jgi:hypothetical protein
VRLFYGGQTVGFDPDITLTGNFANDSEYLGRPVAGAGDVNGDGYDDFLVSATRADEWKGRVFLYSTQARASSAFIEFAPEALGTSSQGRWITCYIEPIGFDAKGIDLRTVRLAGSVPAEPKPAVVGDHDGNHVPDLMVKFDRQALAPLLTLGINHLRVNGSTVTGDKFNGTGDVRLLATPPSSGQLALRLESPAGATPVRIAVRDPAALGRKVTVYDVRGRMISRWIEPSTGIAWDGHAAGRQVASGIYFVRVTEGNRAGTVKVMIAR